MIVFKFIYNITISTVFSKLLFKNKSSTSTIYFITYLNTCIYTLHLHKVKSESKVYTPC